MTSQGRRCSSAHSTNSQRVPSGSRLNEWMYRPPRGNAAPCAVRSTDWIFSDPATAAYEGANATMQIAARDRHDRHLSRLITMVYSSTRVQGSIAMVSRAWIVRETAPCIQTDGCRTRQRRPWLAAAMHAPACGQQGGRERYERGWRGARTGSGARGGRDAREEASAAARATEGGGCPAGRAPHWHAGGPAPGSGSTLQAKPKRKPDLPHTRIIEILARPTGIEPVSRASETLILSIELRAQRGGIVPAFAGRACASRSAASGNARAYGFRPRYDVI